MDEVSFICFMVSASNKHLTSHIEQRKVPSFYITYFFGSYAIVQPNNTTSISTT
jgi:hypothetical protein